VIAYETGVIKEPDPLGGSYYIEELTCKIEQGARDYIAQIDSMGGTLAAIERGYIQSEIQNAAYTYQQEVERGGRIVVGVNKFRLEEEKPVITFRVDPAIETQQIASVRELRATRSSAAVEEKLTALERAARSSDNLMPKIVDACEALATVGEISDRLRLVFGEYREG
jgi:methylmalonyl-CoA mutase N-terminal domain/subunit